MDKFNTFLSSKLIVLRKNVDNDKLSILKMSLFCYGQSHCQRHTYIKAFSRHATAVTLIIECIDTHVFTDPAM